MGLSMSFFSFMYFFSPLFFFQLTSSRQPLCHENESFALLQFKESLVIKKSASVYPPTYLETESASHYPSTYPKTESWDLKENNDCCSWDGVECDEDTGYVIKLDLTSSWLYGSLNSTSNTLFNLVHLQWLSLANNHFSDSKIPYGIKYLSNLSHLNLSRSFFSGQIPPEVLELSNLESLDLSQNELQLQQPGLKSLMEKLTNLKVLDLGSVNIVSSLPQALTNLSSLKILSLSDCNLQGIIPSIGNLNNLTHLDLSLNKLQGKMSSLGNLTHLAYLDMRENGFSNQDLSSLANLTHLNYLDLSYDKFSSLSSLLSWINMNTKLTHLYLSDIGNSFSNLDPSSLANLTHLNFLDLSSNKFLSPSSLFSWINKNTKLTHLYLSNIDNSFSNQDPSSLANLTYLNYLDLSYNKFSSPSSLLSWINKNTELTHLYLSNSGNSFSNQDSSSLANLTHLNYLDLSYNKFSSPSSLLSWINKNTELTHLYLSNIDNSFSNQDPSSLANLTHLNYLDLSYNKFSSPSSLLSWINKNTELIYLRLSNIGNNFSNQDPSSLANLTHLNSLDLFSNNFSSSSSLLSWISKSTELTYLRLSNTNIGEIPFWLLNMNQLSTLRLSSNQISGPIPPQISNLTKLEVLDLSSNQISGLIPPQISNLTKLEVLDLSSNQLQGSIPSSIFELNNLEELALSSNNLSGTMEFKMFLQLKSLSLLDLSSNRLSLLTSSTINATPIKFLDLRLRSCNLKSFPDFLRNQDQLNELDLSSNNITGQIPGWLLYISQQSLQFLNISHNLLTGFDQQPVIISWAFLYYLDLSFNNLQGPLPIPPTSTIQVYRFSHNKMSGELQPWICELNSLVALDLSNNSFSGKLPQCLGNISYAMLMLNLQNNKFRGSIPQTFMNGTNLRMIDLSNNMLQGKIPRSLANCTMLEVLDLGNNKISDTFPSWIATLPNLKVLNLQSNELYGEIKEPKSDSAFPKLQVIDLSHNRFIGKLPSKYFESWNAMKVVNTSPLAYMMKSSSDGTFYDYSIRMVIKGLAMEYEKISNMLVSILLSNNKFEGEIPTSISMLKGLRYLNLSNNNLVGGIPSSFGNLTVLESLDLSNNRLQGEIPQLLVKLTTLEVFDVSSNNLTGTIPQGAQFDTFDKSSYEGNQGLCGKPLSKRCQNAELPQKKDYQKSESLFAFGWKEVAIGYASGLIIGVVLGYLFCTRKYDWFVKIFGMPLKRVERKRGRRRN